MSLVDDEALDLVEHRRVGLVVVGAVDPARGDHPDRRALVQHRADLDRRGVGAQHVRRAVIAVFAVHVEGVELLARGVVRGDVQRVEVVPIVLDLRALGDGEAHVGEDRGDLLGDLADRVDGPRRAGPRGQGHVEPFGLEALVEGGVAQRLFLCGEGGVDLVLQRVELRTHDLAFLGRHLAELAHFQRHFALLADGGDADLFERGFIRRSRDRVQVLQSDLVHSGTSNSLEEVLAGAR